MLSAIFLYIIRFTVVLLDVFIWLIIIDVIFGWLINLRVVNPYNRTVNKLWVAIHSAVYPLYEKIRRVIPPLGGLDLSPLVLFFLIGLIQQILVQIGYNLI